MSLFFSILLESRKSKACKIEALQYLLQCVAVAGRGRKVKERHSDRDHRHLRGHRHTGQRTDSHHALHMDTVPPCLMMTCLHSTLRHMLPWRLMQAYLHNPSANVWTVVLASNTIHYNTCNHTYLWKNNLSDMKQFVWLIKMYGNRRFSSLNPNYIWTLCRIRTCK